MTDAVIVPRLGANRLDVSSETAKRRIKRRYAAERRYRAYGIAAIGVTALFLVALLVDIVRNGFPAFIQHSVVLDVAIPGDLVPADKRTDPVAIRSADYFPVTRDALKIAIPGLQGRQAERSLTRLLSSGASDTLTSHLIRDPSGMGKTINMPLRLSATADLYFKGGGADIRSVPARGTATPSGTSGQITVLSSANDFAMVVDQLNRNAAERIGEREAEKRRISLFGADVTKRLSEIDEEVAVLRKRLESPGTVQALDGNVPSQLVEINGGLVKITSLSSVRVTGEVLLPLASTADAGPGSWKVVTYGVPESNRKITDQEVAYLERLNAMGKVHAGFNWAFFVSGDSREPELAGIRGAVVGSALTLLVTLALCLPIGVLAAVYLEEFAAKNRLTDLIEVNINNLAAVPSIVFGLLGLAVFLNFFNFPRSAPLVGGLVLALMSLPTIIIAARAAIKAVPPSIKEAALGVGASHQQAVFHHVLPLAMPGILTGTIIAMAQALGETAPLLMIGMVAFIVDVPGGITDAATVLPVQIYLWSDLPELAFRYKTAAAIIVLLAFLFLMNGTAIWLRNKFERRW